MALPTPCPWCGSRRGVVHVHSHEQCLTCGSNTAPCCAGADANDAAAVRNQPRSNAGPAPTLFPTLFMRLGGEQVTVTTDALLFVLSNHLGSDYDEARLVLEAAERVGIVRTAQPGLHGLRADGQSDS